jgi:hypothetical protein
MTHMWGRSGEEIDAICGGSRFDDYGIGAGALVPSLVPTQGRASEVSFDDIPVTDPAELYGQVTAEAAAAHVESLTGLPTAIKASALAITYEG